LNLRSSRTATAARTADLESSVDQSDFIELKIWLRLLTCANLGGTALRRWVDDDFGTTLPRFDVLAQLARHPDGLAMGQLSKRLMVTNGNVTGLVNNMIGEGLVRRARSTTDRRSQTVRLMPAGQLLFEQIAHEHRKWVGHLLSGMSGERKTTLYAALGELKRSLNDKTQWRD
jgi:DNA-binding MarR family transcriptional regulator